MSSAELLNSLSHPTRLDIVQLLHAEQGLCVNDVANRLQISQANASRHLCILNQGGAVVFERQLNKKIYKAKPLVIELINTANEVVGC